MWLASMKLEEYSARIMDYGYDSMHALDLADGVFSQLYDIP